MFNGAAATNADDDQQVMVLPNLMQDRPVAAKTRKDTGLPPIIWKHGAHAGVARPQPFCNGTEARGLIETLSTRILLKRRAERPQNHVGIKLR